MFLNDITEREINHIKDRILRLCLERGVGKSICPSEVARSFFTDENEWRAMMDDVRAAALALANQNRIIVLHKGKPVNIEITKGPIRFGLP
ncbi:MAG: DUF3253 domain-containing protein [Pseudomonadota bacterium]